MAVYKLNESSNKQHIIWDSEIDYYNEDAIEEIKDGWYQEYVDDCELTGEEPDDFDTWYDDYVTSMYEVDQEELAEELDSIILPKIEDQINNGILLLSGNYGSNYPDFRPSGDGCIFWNDGVDDLREFLSNFNRVQITTEQGILGIRCLDHDGTISGQLFTLPDDMSELAVALGYEEDDESECSYDIYYGYTDERELNNHLNLLKPIEDTISGYNKDTFRDRRFENKGLGENFKLNESSNNRVIINNILNKIEDSAYYASQGSTDKVYSRVMNDLKDAIDISLVINMKDIPNRTPDGDPIKYRYSVYTNDGDFNFYFDPYREYIYINNN